jgi:hypothetical protein
LISDAKIALFSHTEALQGTEIAEKRVFLDANQGEAKG